MKHHPSPTHSVWMDMEKPQFPTLAENVETDVCIVGAGLAGLTTAYLLSRENVSVTLLESKEILSGETEHTTAHVTNVLDHRYYEIARKRGKKNAKLAIESHGAAIELIEQIVKDEKIECDFERIDGYLFAPANQSSDVIDRELKTVHDLGWDDVERLDRAPIEGRTGACLRFPNQAMFHPTNYASALAEICAKQGVKIFTQTHVTSIKERTIPFTVLTKQGKTVTCKRLVVATNAPINDNPLIFSKQTPYRSFVLGFDIKKGAVHKGLYWDTLSPYHYVRIQPHPESAEKEILIVGGEDYRNGAEDRMDANLKKLEEWGQKMFGITEQASHRWSGMVLNTFDSLALIGKKPLGHKHSYIITGDSGIGMTHCTIGGMIITDLIQKRKNPWSALYSPSRLPPVTWPTYLKENFDTFKHIVGDWVSGGDRKQEESIKAGEGAVMHRGIKKIALYRDDAGTLHKMSAVCPHKGCIVRWNSGEKMWDCPCHGSRYDALGNVINGPSRRPLKKLG